MLWNENRQHLHKQHPVMKWPLVKSKLHIFILFSQQSSHLFIDSIRKEPDLTVPGIWPLCYSWIGYLQANGPPWVLLSFCVDHDCSCRQRRNADNSNLFRFLAPPRCCQWFTCYFLWQKSAVYCLFLLVHPLHHGQMGMMYFPIPAADRYYLSSFPTQNTPVPSLLLQLLRFVLCLAL